MKWLENSCACGSCNNHVLMFSTFDHNFSSTTEECNVYKCLDCGSFFPEKFPSTESLGAAYANYYTAPKIRSGSRRFFRKLIDSTRRPYMLRSTPKNVSSVLDYGCGAGDYLLDLKDKKYAASLYGTDLFEPTNIEGTGFTWLPIDKFDHSHQLYEWITLSHVIEHLAVVDDVLGRLMGALAPNGSLWLSTPNADSILLKYFKGFCRDVDFPRHKQIYSTKLLEQSLNSMGWSVKFLSPPRINMLLNLFSCISNLVRSDKVSIYSKAKTISSASIAVLVHLFRSQKLRNFESAEIILVCSFEANNK